MKNRFRLLAGMLVLFLSATFVGAGLANAHSFRSGTNVTVGQGEVIEDTVFAAGRTIDINSEVFGDVFCAGQTITISGTVHGDVICAGQTVNVTGKVDGDVRLAGQTVTLGAEISGNATVAGQNFNLESTGSVGGDISIGSTDATLNGSIGRHVAASSANLIIASNVGGDIKSTVTNLQLTDNAKVGGNIEYTSWNELNRSEKAQVAGEVTKNEPAKGGESKRGAIFGFGVGWFIYLLLAMLFTALALTLLFPRLLHSVTDQGLPMPWKPLLIGFVAALALPVILLVLAVTVIGLPFAFLLGLIWLVVLMLSVHVFGYYVGRLVLRDSRQPLLIMLVGASILLVAYFIPIVGFLALLAATWIGSGMILLEIFGRTPRPSYDLTPATTTRRKS